MGFPPSGNPKRPGKVGDVVNRTLVHYLSISSFFRTTVIASMVCEVTLSGFWGILLLPVGFGCCGYAVLQFEGWNEAREKLSLPGNQEISDFI